MVYQKTIQKEVLVSGLGLHSGQPSSLLIRPAPEGTGIYFMRKDLSGGPFLKAQSRNVKATQLATVLGGELFHISTVEHCMSAIAALGLDNLILELKGPELPICDGSAQPYFEALQEAGIIEQHGLKKYVHVTQPIYFAQGDKYAYVLPYDRLKLSCSIDFSHPQIGHQKIELDVNPYAFERELSMARTFGFAKEVELLKQKGLVRGGSLENAIVLDEQGILNPEGLRIEREFVRHKAMDALGDLMMLGAPLLGHVVVHKAGHDLMHGFVEKVLASTDCFSMTERLSPQNIYTHL